MSFITLSAFKRHFHMVRECAFAPDSELSHTSSPPFRPYIILLQLKIWPVGYQLWGHHRAPLDAGDHCFSISCNPSYFQSNSFFFYPCHLGLLPEISPVSIPLAFLLHWVSKWLSNSLHFFLWSCWGLREEFWLSFLCGFCQSLMFYNLKMFDSTRVFLWQLQMLLQSSPQPHLCCLQ